MASGVFMANDLPFSDTHMLSLLESRVEYLNQEERALSEKAQKNLEAITIILGIFGAFHFSRDQQVIEWLLGAIFLIYIAVAALSTYVLLRPRNWKLPVNVSLDEINEFKALDTATYILSLQYSYIEAITFNQNILRTRTRIVRACLYAVVLDISLIILLAGASTPTTVP
jgi:hypothetical protein